MLTDENEISGIVVDCAVKLHSHFGPGIFETVYHGTLKHDLEERGLSVVSEKRIGIEYKGLVFDEGFRTDLIVNERVILELKSVEKILSVHKKQLLTYLKLTGLRVGLLLNFGAEFMKDGIVRIVNNMDDSTP